MYSPKQQTPLLSMTIMATLRNDIGIFCLVDKFNHHYLLNLEKRFWNIHLSFLTFKIILTETKGPSIASIYPRSMFSETTYSMISGKYTKTALRFVGRHICFQTRKLRKRLLLLGIANNVPNWSLDCDLVPTGRVGGTPATTRAADEFMADTHHLLQTG